jgi:hypothetical protein
LLNDGDKLICFRSCGDEEFFLGDEILKLENENNIAIDAQETITYPVLAIFRRKEIKVFSQGMDR